jgi:hypothetical protein
MDYQDFNMRKNLSTFVAPGVPKSIEWVWQGSKTFGSQYQTFTGELYGDGSGGYASAHKTSELEKTIALNYCAQVRPAGRHGL